MLNIIDNIYKKNDKFNFMPIFDETLKVFGLEFYNDEALDDLVNAHIINDYFITREEISLFIAFQIFKRNILKNHVKENELVFTVAEEGSKLIILKIRELGFDSITNKIDLSKEFKLTRLEKNTFYKEYYLRFDQSNTLIERPKNKKIRVYFPNDDGGVYINDKNCSHVDLNINPFNLPLGFIRSGMDYLQVNENGDYTHYKLGNRSIRKMKDWLIFNLEEKCVNKNEWKCIIIP